MDNSEEQLSEELKFKRICRFCLTQEEPLSDIFVSNQAEASGNKTKTSPLTLQIMACVAIEVYKEDGMPCTICDNCRHFMDHSYRFKQMCKKADTLLKTYPITGVWPEKLQVPVNLFKCVTLIPPSKPPVRQLPVQQKAPSASIGAKPKQNVIQIHDVKIIKKGTSPVKAPPVTPSVVTEPTEDFIIPDSSVAHLQIEPVEEDVKPKIVKLSIEDLKQIKQGKSINKTNFIMKSSSPSKKDEAILTTNRPCASGRRPEKQCPVKVINGSLGAVSKKPVILNSLRPPSNKTEEHFVQTGDGTLEIVCIESLDQEVVDPIKNAPPVETHVFPCPECERSFPLRQLLDIHMKNHNRERNYPCELCDRRFFSKYDLAKHNLTHTGERPYVCIICKAAFSRSTLLTRHQKVHKDMPKYLCMYCERTFLSNEDLQKHCQFHQKRRPFQCQKCPKSFAYKQGLERHEVTHETNLPFPCEHCDLTFATAGKLARHLTAHAGSRPYPCRMCSRSFMLSHHLTRHVRSHQGGQGAYKCNDCTSVFDNQDDLIYHSAEHATKSLTCPLCREHFETLEQVTEHIKEHSEGIQYACDYCDLLFTTEQKLDTHCQKEHLSVLAMDRTETANNSTDDSESSQQFIIEEISINKDGSQLITTFVDGKEKEKKFVQKERGKVIKTEITVEKTRLQVQEECNEEENEDGQLDEECYYDDEELQEEEAEEQPKEVLIKNEKLEPMNKSKSTAVPAQKPPVSKPATPKASPAVDAQKSVTQQKLDAFFKKAQIPVTSSSSKTVGDVLKNLPKGVVVRRPAATTPTPSPVEKKTEPSPKGSPNGSTPPKPPTMAPKSVAVQKKSPANVQLPQRTSDVSTAKNNPVKPQPTKSSPRIAAKRPAEPSKSPSPTKKMAVEPKTPAASGSSTKPVAKAVLKPGATIPGSAKKGKTFEMKIGDKMVKVQKVVMTKAEVAAMARDGKIEMQGDTMILKQTKAKKQ
ncbi:zinc finger protein pita-like [Ochlerotatus camptorhynchus]|uniref:zinc finger protein pita-like n=1 Tax=Ochlerotatus camptorhynchus TaxID=644619 RepID=UPI0031DF471B